jgi:hypothetical protein
MQRRLQAASTFSCCDATHRPPIRFSDAAAARRSRCIRSARSARCVRARARSGARVHAGAEGRNGNPRVRRQRAMQQITMRVPPRAAPSFALGLRLVGAQASQSRTVGVGHGRRCAWSVTCCRACCRCCLSSIIAWCMAVCCTLSVASWQSRVAGCTVSVAMVSIAWCLLPGVCCIVSDAWYLLHVCCNGIGCNGVCCMVSVAMVSVAMVSVAWCLLHGVCCSGVCCNCIGCMVSVACLLQWYRLHGIGCNGVCCMVSVAWYLLQWYLLQRYLLQWYLLQWCLLHGVCCNGICCNCIGCMVSVAWYLLQWCLLYGVCCMVSVAMVSVAWCLLQ